MPLFWREDELTLTGEFLMIAVQLNINISEMDLSGHGENHAGIDVLPYRTVKYTVFSNIFCLQNQSITSASSDQNII